MDQNNNNNFPKLVTKKDEEEKNLRESDSNRMVSFPDPNPLPNQGPYVDDVTRLNSTPVTRVFTPRNLKDIQDILYMARHNKIRISARGTKHSMGGQSIARNGYIISMPKINHITFSSKTSLVTCGSGCHWTDVIIHLNRFGKSPKTMQSYSSFSVGGSLSVNAHGITNDFTITDCVESFILIKWDGLTVKCSRNEKGEGKELFGLVLGGYGLFGIIYEVTMKVNDNFHLDMDIIHTNPKEFPRIYENILENPQNDIDIKLARLDITNLEHIELFVFRKANDFPTVSLLSYEPRSQNFQSRMIYKWLAPTMQELRFKLEREMGFAMDWSDSSDRNTLMFESADSLAQLSQNIFQVDDTFILQEYFIPRKSFLEWLPKAKPIYIDISNAKILSLLNTTIRFVHEDKDTVLRYSPNSNGMYAFVLYYRMQRTKEADKLLETFHQRFVQITQEVGGTFYLPYRHHYSIDQMKTSYPCASSFFEKKMKYDPHGMFYNIWFEKYGLPFCSTEYQKIFQSPPLTPREERRIFETPPNPEYKPKIVNERRKQSYLKLVSSPTLRKAFIEGFLTKVFNIENKQMLYRMITKCVWDPRNNQDDFEIYSSLQEELNESRGIFSKLSTFWKQIKQLRDQKNEIANETASILGKIGKVGKIHDYCSIGDFGKMVLPLRKILGMKGKVWIVHDQKSDDIPAILERGASEPTGELLTIDYNFPGNLKLNIPNEGVDLVTLNQGLHHFPQDQIMNFLKEIFRILRPGGLFILREHNANEELMPMLDLAHSVFNACLGVPRGEEKNEIRAFRSIEDWKEIVQAAGLIDTLVYEIQKGDPTEDEMICFYKPPFNAKLPIIKTETIVKENTVPTELPPELNTLLSQGPSFFLKVIEDLQKNLLKKIPKWSEFLKTFTQGLSSGQKMIANELIDQSFRSLSKIVERFDPYLKHVDLRSGSSSLDSFLPPEIFLIIPALKKKVKSGKASPYEMIIVSILKDLRVRFFPKEKDKLKEKKETTEDLLLPIESEIPDVSPRDIQSEITLLFEALPQLKHPSWLSNAGFSSLASMTLKSKLSATNPNELAKQMAALVDPKSWKNIAICLKIIREKKIMPHAKFLFGERGIEPKENPWGHALFALLGSPKVYFKRDTLMMMGWAGLSDMIEMWKLSQKLRREEDPPIEISTSLTVTQLQAALEDLADQQLITKEIKEGYEEDIVNVREIKLATFGYTSLTARPHDVTQVLKDKFLKGSVLKIKGVNLKEELSSSSTPINTLDSIRKLATLSTNKLVVTYYTNEEPEPNILLPRISNVLKKIAESGILPTNLPNRDSKATWYKLPEWMQVELIQIFGNSLEHTPWYRFPFMKYLILYFSTLGKEFNIVKSKHGILNALVSKYLLVDFIPGIVMSVILGQLQLLALPLVYTKGSEYEDSKIVEHMVVKFNVDQSNKASPNWEKIDKRIILIQKFCPGLQLLQVPTFKGMTEILVKMALQTPDVRILEISKQRELQMKVSLSEENLKRIEKLKNLHGCQVMFTFQFPTVGKEKFDTMISLQITLPYILSVIRFCLENNIKIVQIYDTF